MDSPDSFRCPRCLNRVLSGTYAIHEATCHSRAPDIQQSGSKYSHSQDSNSRRMEVETPMFCSPKSDSRSYPSNSNKSYREGRREQSSNSKQDDMQTICPKCSECLSIAQIRQHMDQCAYDPCKYCREYYPREFIRSHQRICEVGDNYSISLSMTDNERFFSDRDSELRQSNIESPFSSGYSTPSRSSLSRDNSLNSTLVHLMPMDLTPSQFERRNYPVDTAPRQSNHTMQRTRQDGLNNVITITTNYPRSYETIIQIRAEPFFINQNSNLSLNNQNSMRPNMYLQIDQDQLDPFLSNFLNHGNFMRINRFLLNEEFIENLLSQFFNPNDGVERENLRNLEEVVFKKNSQVIPGEEEKCAVCITEFENEERIRRLPCRHIFHINCVDTWLVQNSHCPVCKMDINQVFAQSQGRRGRM